jgi:hypothetical protein
MEMGVVTGGIYSWKSAGEGIVLEQALLDRADEIFMEFKGLGGNWVRIEANWNLNYDGQYTFIADKAHAHGLKVIVVLTAGKEGRITPFCRWQQQGKDRDLWFQDYVTELNRLATQVFFTRNQINAQADAYEIQNEPNQFDASAKECANTGRYRMDGDSFAWLLRFVWRWKSDNSRPEKIISGGTINSFFDSPSEPWWNNFFASGAFFAEYGERPFDYFGVHPYNEAKPAAEWKSVTKQTLIGLASKLDVVTRKSGTRLYVTEFGNPSKARMKEGIEAFRESGVVPVALWYDYRDDVPGGFGLRSMWNASQQRYPVKDLWAQFKTLAGGTGSDDPESYWQSWNLPNRDPYGFLDYATTTAIGGWAYDPDTINPIYVDIYIDGLRAATVRAEGFRPDLAPAGVAPNGAHGYTFPTPSLSLGCHTVTAVALNHRGGANPALPSSKQVCRYN